MKGKDSKQEEITRKEREGMEIIDDKRKGKEVRGKERI